MSEHGITVIVLTLPQLFIGFSVLVLATVPVPTPVKYSQILLLWAASIWAWAQ